MPALCYCSTRMARCETTVSWKKSRSVRMLAAVCGSFSLFWLTTACQTSCGDANQQPINYADGKTHTEDGLRIYETTPRDGEWLHFPSYRRFKLEHNLKTTAYTPFILIAFSSHPVASISDASDDVAIASGDVAVIEKIGDNSMIIRNDTCSEQYLYVKLTAGIDVDAGAN